MALIAGKVAGKAGSSGPVIAKAKTAMSSGHVKAKAKVATFNNSTATAASGSNSPRSGGPVLGKSGPTKSVVTSSTAIGKAAGQSKSGGPVKSKIQQVTKKAQGTSGQQVSQQQSQSIPQSQTDVTSDNPESQIQEGQEIEDNSNKSQTTGSRQQVSNETPTDKAAKAESSGTSRQLSSSNKKISNLNGPGSASSSAINQNQNNDNITINGNITGSTQIYVTGPVGPDGAQKQNQNMPKSNGKTLKQKNSRYSSINDADDLSEDESNLQAGAGGQNFGDIVRLQQIEQQQQLYQSNLPIEFQSALNIPQQQQQQQESNTKSQQENRQNAESVSETQNKTKSSSSSSSETDENLSHRTDKTRQANKNFVAAAKEKMTADFGNISIISNGSIIRSDAESVKSRESNSQRSGPGMASQIQIGNTKPQDSRLELSSVVNDIMIKQSQPQSESTQPQALSQANTVDESRASDKPSQSLDIINNNNNNNIDSLSSSKTQRSDSSERPSSTKKGKLKAKKAASPGVKVSTVTKNGDTNVSLTTRESAAAAAAATSNTRNNESAGNLESDRFTTGSITKLNDDGSTVTFGYSKTLNIGSVITNINDSFNFQERYSAAEASRAQSSVGEERASGVSITQTEIQQSKSTNSKMVHQQQQKIIYNDLQNYTTVPIAPQDDNGNTITNSKSIKSDSSTNTKMKMSNEDALATLTQLSESISKMSNALDSKYETEKNQALINQKMEDYETFLQFLTQYMEKTLPNVIREMKKNGEFDNGQIGSGNKRSLSSASRPGTGMYTYASSKQPFSLYAPSARDRSRERGTNLMNQRILPSGNTNTGASSSNSMSPSASGPGGPHYHHFMNYTQSANIQQSVNPNRSVSNATQIKQNINMNMSNTEQGSSTPSYGLRSRSRNKNRRQMSELYPRANNPFNNINKANPFYKPEALLAAGYNTQHGLALGIDLEKLGIHIADNSYLYKSTSTNSRIRSLSGDNMLIHTQEEQQQSYPGMKTMANKRALRLMQKRRRSEIDRMFNNTRASQLFKKNHNDPDYQHHHHAIKHYLGNEENLDLLSNHYFSHDSAYSLNRNLDYHNRPVYNVHGEKVNPNRQDLLMLTGQSTLGNSTQQTQQSKSLMNTNKSVKSPRLDDGKSESKKTGPDEKDNDKGKDHVTDQKAENTTDVKDEKVVITADNHTSNDIDEKVPGPVNDQNQNLSNNKQILQPPGCRPYKTGTHGLPYVEGPHKFTDLLRHDTRKTPKDKHEWVPSGNEKARFNVAHLNAGKLQNQNQNQNLGQNNNQTDATATTGKLIHPELRDLYDEALSHHIHRHGGTHAAVAAPTFYDVLSGTGSGVGVDAKHRNPAYHDPRVRSLSPTPEQTKKLREMLAERAYVRQQRRHQLRMREQEKVHKLRMILNGELDVAELDGDEAEEITQKLKEHREMLNQFIKDTHRGHGTYFVTTLRNHDKRYFNNENNGVTVTVNGSKSPPPRGPSQNQNLLTQQIQQNLIMDEISKQESGGPKINGGMDKDSLKNKLKNMSNLSGNDRDIKGDTNNKSQMLRKMLSKLENAKTDTDLNNFLSEVGISPEELVNISSKPDSQISDHSVTALKKRVRAAIETRTAAKENMSYQSYQEKMETERKRQALLDLLNSPPTSTSSSSSVINSQSKVKSNNTSMFSNSSGQSYKQKTQTGSPNAHRERFYKKGPYVISQSPQYQPQQNFLGSNITNATDLSNFTESALVLNEDLDTLLAEQSRLYGNNINTNTFSNSNLATINGMPRPAWNNHNKQLLVDERARQSHANHVAAARASAVYKEMLNAAKKKNLQQYELLCAEYDASHDRQDNMSEMLQMQIRELTQQIENGNGNPDLYQGLGLDSADQQQLTEKQNQLIQHILKSQTDSEQNLQFSELPQIEIPSTTSNNIVDEIRDSAANASVSNVDGQEEELVSGVAERISGQSISNLIDSDGNTNIISMGPGSESGPGSAMPNFQSPSDHQDSLKAAAGIGRTSGSESGNAQAPLNNSQGQTVTQTLTSSRLSSARVRQEHAELTQQTRQMLERHQDLMNLVESQQKILMEREEKIRSIEEQNINLKKKSVQSESGHLGDNMDVATSLQTGSTVLKEFQDQQNTNQGHGDSFNNAAIAIGHGQSQTEGHHHHHHHLSESGNEHHHHHHHSQYGNEHHDHHHHHSHDHSSVINNTVTQGLKQPGGADHISSNMQQQLMERHSSAIMLPKQHSVTASHSHSVIEKHSHSSTGSVSHSKVHIVPGPGPPVTTHHSAAFGMTTTVTAVKDRSTHGSHYSTPKKSHDLLNHNNQVSVHSTRSVPSTTKQSQSHRSSQDNHKTSHNTSNTTNPVTKSSSAKHSSGNRSTGQDKTSVNSSISKDIDSMGINKKTSPSVTPIVAPDSVTPPVAITPPLTNTNTNRTSDPNPIRKSTNDSGGSSEKSESKILNNNDILAKKSDHSAAAFATNTNSSKDGSTPGRQVASFVKANAANPTVVTPVPQVPVIAKTPSRPTNTGSIRGSGSSNANKDNSSSAATPIDSVTPPLVTDSISKQSESIVSNTGTVTSTINSSVIGNIGAPKRPSSSRIQQMSGRKNGGGSSGSNQGNSLNASKQPVERVGDVTDIENHVMNNAANTVNGNENNIDGTIISTQNSTIVTVAANNNENSGVAAEPGSASTVGAEDTTTTNNVTTPPAELPVTVSDTITNQDGINQNDLKFIKDVIEDIKTQKEYYPVITPTTPATPKTPKTPVTTSEQAVVVPEEYPTRRDSSSVPAINIVPGQPGSEKFNEIEI